MLAKLSSSDLGLSVSTFTHITTHCHGWLCGCVKPLLLLKPHHPLNCTQAPASLDSMPPWLLQSVDIYGNSTGDSASFWCGAAVPAASGVTMQKMVGELWEKGKGLGGEGGQGGECLTPSCVAAITELLRSSAVSGHVCASVHRGM